MRLRERLQERYDDTDGGVWISPKRIQIDTTPDSIPGQAGLKKLPFRWFLRTTLSEMTWYAELGVVPCLEALSRKMVRDIRSCMGREEEDPIDELDAIHYGTYIVLKSASRSWAADEEDADDWDDEAPLEEALRELETDLKLTAHAASMLMAIQPVNRIGQNGWSYLYEDIRGFLRKAPPSDARDTMQAMYGQPGRVVLMRQDTVRGCKFRIIDPGHYRMNGTCRCNDEWHRKMMIKEWGYKPKDFKDIPLEGED